MAASQYKRRNKRIGSAAVTEGNTAMEINTQTAEPKIKISPKKRSNLVRLNEKQIRHARHQSINPLRAVLSVVSIFVGLVLVSSVIYGQVKLTELTSEIDSATYNLNQLKSVQVQLQMKSDSLMTADEVQKYASENLGMEKINSNQITYVSMDETDNGQVYDPEAGKNIFEKIYDKLMSMIP
jgi:cell division protein FtsL